MNRESSDRPGLDAETDGAFTAAIGTEPADAALMQRVKGRVLREIALRDQSHLTVHVDEGAWRAFAPGVQIKVLHREGGVMSYLLKLAAGASVPAHRHPHDEECVVLEGTLKIGDTLTVSAGGFHLARRGALHDTLSTVGGATIFLRGAVPEPSHLIRS